VARATNLSAAVPDILGSSTGKLVYVTRKGLINLYGLQILTVRVLSYARVQFYSCRRHFGNLFDWLIV
jgi:hypothetical protein